MLGNAGKTSAEALHKPHSLRKLHVAGSTRSLRERDAKYVWPLPLGGRYSRMLTFRQTNIRRAIQEPGIMEAMSISTRLNGSVRKEHYKHSG